MYTYTIVVDTPPRWERAHRRYRVDSVVVPPASKPPGHGGINVDAQGYHGVAWPRSLLRLCERTLATPSGRVEIVCCDVDTALPYGLFVSDVVITSSEPPPGPPLASSVAHAVTRTPARFAYTVPGAICAANGHSRLWRQFYTRECNRSVKVAGPCGSARIRLDRGVVCTPTGTGVRRALAAYAAVSQRRTVVLTDTPDVWQSFRGEFVHINVSAHPTDRVIVENAPSAMRMDAFFTWFLSDSTTRAGLLAVDIVSAASTATDPMCTGRAYHRMCGDAAIVRSVHGPPDPRRTPACAQWTTWPAELGPMPSIVTRAHVAADKSSHALTLRPQTCACGELGCLQHGAEMTCLWCGTERRGSGLASMRDISFDGMLLGVVLIALARRGALHVVVWGPNEMLESLRPCLNRHHQWLRTPGCQREHGGRQVITWYDTESSTQPTPRNHDCVVVCCPTRATAPILHDEQVCRSIRACNGQWHLVHITCT